MHFARLTLLWPVNIISIQTVIEYLLTFNYISHNGFVLAAKAWKCEKKQ